MSRPELVSSSDLDPETSADAPPPHRGRRLLGVVAAFAVVAGAAVAGPKLINVPDSEGVCPRTTFSGADWPSL